MSKHCFYNGMILILFFVFSLVVISSPILANDNPYFDLREMPVKTIRNNDGEVFLQRERTDIERIVGYVEGRLLKWTPSQGQFSP